MKLTVTESMFIDRFHSMRPDNFSYEGLSALFDYLEEYDDCCDEEMELDVIAICCDFCEYEDLEELQQSYPDIEDMDDLRDHTTVIEFGIGHFIIQNY